MQVNDHVLVVDDNATNREVLTELLGDEMTVRCAACGDDALRIAPAFEPNLVLMDVMMPGLDGYDTCRRMRRIPELAMTKIVMLSAKRGVQDRLAGYDAGALDYITKPFDCDEVVAKVRTWMSVSSAHHVEGLWREIEVTRDAMGTTLAWVTALRDYETGEHLFRLRWYSQAIAEQLASDGPFSHEIDEAFLQNLYRASPLHDVGKVAVSDAVLLKNGPLTPQERAAMREHTTLGAELLQRSTQQLPTQGFLGMAADIARHHHERFDGKGYPDGLRGTQIPLAARIVAVADVFDAMVSRRVYKPAMAFSEAYQYIVNESGSHFDPAIVHAFVIRSDDFRQACDRFQSSHFVQDPLLV